MRAVLLLIAGALVGYFAGMSLHLLEPARSLPNTFFDEKVFYPSDDAVYVAATLTGEGVSHKYNTTQITCYKDRMVCALFVQLLAH